jgi:hypothetical protein
VGQRGGDGGVSRGWVRGEAGLMRMLEAAVLAFTHYMDPIPCICTANLEGDMSMDIQDHIQASMCWRKTFLNPL